ncbi:MAG: hypothetical protein NTY35_09990 [Planctomycetota bacterium]|nr:hypothetical protein [Planctomycetota bacterium]
MRTPSSIPRPWAATGLAGAVLALATASCRLAEGVVATPGEILGVATGGSSTAPVVDLERARREVTALADDLVVQIDVAAYLYAREEGTALGTRQALQFRIAAAERALAAATEPRPLSALADLVALAAYEAQAHESYWRARLGAADQPMLDAWKRLEAQGLAAAEGLLSSEQVTAMREALAAWRATATDSETLVKSGAPRFTELAHPKSEKDASGSLLGTLGLDPLDKIEPAAREVARARELAERGLFLAQRAPRLLAWRIELLTSQLTEQPDIQSVLRDLERTSLAAESVAATAAVLPEQIRTEGDALLRRASAELTAQRAGIVADLERTSAPTQDLLKQVEATLDAGTRMSQALDTTTRSVDAFVARVSPPGSKGDGAGASSPEGSPSKPFDPVEYTALAAQVTQAIQELSTAVAMLDRSLPAAQRSVDDTAARLDRSVESAYGLALRLVLIAIGATTAAVLLVRTLGRRRARDAAP